jgi:hypothetical protein
MPLGSFIKDDCYWDVIHIRCTNVGDWVIFYMIACA